MRIQALLVLISMSPGAAPAVEFDCIQIPANPVSRPPDCDNPDHPFFDPAWCACLKTGLTSLRGGESAAFEQAIIEVYHQPTIGKQVLSVSGGTLDLSGLSVDDEIGQLLIDSFSGQAENFFLDFQMVVTGLDEGWADFDIIIRTTNATSIAILTYDPMDASHSSGLTFRGSVKSAGPGRGFQLSYEYAGDNLPPDATSTGLEIGDLFNPGFSVPVLLTFPTAKIYTLPDSGPLAVETVIDQLFTDPTNPVQRTFEDVFQIQAGPKEAFRRGDTNGDGTIDLSDAVFELNFLFLGGETPACPDAGDLNDDGLLDISDPVSSLNFQFLGGEPPPSPGPGACGPDPTGDALGVCIQRC